MKITDWIVDEHGCFRMIVGGDKDNPKDRVAMIEKTPRVKVKRYDVCIELDDGCGATRPSNDVWIYGDKGDCIDVDENGEYKIENADISSRRWCDEMLILLGYINVE